MLNCITCLFLSWCHFAFGSWQCCCHDKGIPKYWKEWSDFAPGDCQLYASCMWSCLCYLSKRILDVQCSYVLTYCITALIILKFWPLNPVGHSCIYIQSSFAWEFITITNQPYLFSCIALWTNWMSVVKDDISHTNTFLNSIMTIHEVFLSSCV